MNDDNNSSGTKAFPSAEHESKAEDVRRPGPAWEGRRHRSEAADCAASGCQVTTLLPASSIEPVEMPLLLDGNIFPSAEGDPRHKTAAADVVKDGSNVIVPNAITPKEIEASDCTGEEDTSGGFPASNGGNVAKIPRRQIGHVASLGTPRTPSPNRPTNQYRFDSTADVDQRNSDGVAKSELSKESCVAGAAETTAALQQTQQEARRAFAAQRALESNIDLDRVPSTNNDAAERDRRNSRRVEGDFETLLMEAMQQSDAERVQDREDASNFAMMQNLSLQEEQEHHSHKTTPGPTRSAKNDSADDSTSDLDLDNGGQTDSKDGTCTNIIATIDSRLLSVLPASISEVTPARSQWVQYISPEGYPYLYNEVTGDSKWAAPGEVEGGDSNKSHQVRGPTGDKSSREQGSTEVTLRSQDGQMDPHGITVANAEGEGVTADVAEHSSASTCDVSQWSKDSVGPDARNFSGETAMHLAAAQRSLRGLSLLLANGAYIDATDHRGRTPLHAVCVSARGSYSGGQNDLALLECTNLLLSYGALEDARDGEGQTPLHLAALAGNLSAARALLKAGAKVTADDTGNSPLHIAAARGHSDIIQLLVDENKHELTRQPPLSHHHARDHGWSFGEVGRLGMAIDSVLMIEEKQAGNFPVDGRKGTFPGNRGEDSGAVARVNRRWRSAEQEASSSREYSSLSTSREIQTVTRGPSPSKADHRYSGECHFLESTPGSLDGHFRRAGVHHEKFEAGCPEDTGTRGKIFENPTPEAIRTSDMDTFKDRGSGRLASDHGRRRRSEGKERRRHISGHPRLRRGDDRGDRILRWPEALPEPEYQKIMQGVLGGKEDSCRRPSRSTVSAALFAACLGSRSIDVAAVLRLLELHGGKVADVWDDNGRTPLHHVCRADDVGLLHLLYRAGADIEARDCQGNSPLAVAAAMGSLACLQVIIQEGIYLCGFNDVGDTPLHLAVRHGNLACVKALVEGGARLSQRNKQGFTPREDLLKTAPTFSGGRLPKVLRITLDYIDCVEPEPSTWTVQGGYQSQETTDTAAPLQKRAGGHLHDDDFGAYSARDELQFGTGDDSGDKGLAIKPFTDANLPSARRERRHHQRREGYRDLRGGGDTDHGRSEVFSDGSMRRDSNRRDSGVGHGGMRQAPKEDAVRVQRRSDSSREGETRGGYSQETSVASASAPSRVRKGVWSVVGRTIDAFIGGGNGEHQDRPQSAANGSDYFNDGDEVHDNGRPPTDAGLRARMGSDEEESLRANGSDILGGSSQLQSPPSTEPVNVPISLTPMKPPPDVVAAMKGRAAVGQRRRRLIPPPADVAAVLEKSRGSMGSGHREAYGSVLGADDYVS